MFFDKAPSDQHQYANRVVNNFCKLAMSDDLPIDKQIESVHMTLVWLGAMLDFGKNEEKLRNTQKGLQASSQNKQDQNTRKKIFDLATAMNTLIFYFSKEEDDEQRKFFVTVVQSRVQKLQARKASLEQKKLTESSKNLDLPKFRS
jgi:hypothetical protein